MAIIRTVEEKTPHWGKVREQRKPIPLHMKPNTYLYMVWWFVQLCQQTPRKRRGIYHGEGWKARGDLCGVGY